MTINNMINAGYEFRRAFLELLRTFGGTVMLHKDFNCEYTKTIELIGMKNNETKDPSTVIFQFPERFEVNKGDVLQQKSSSDYWVIYKTEDKVISETFIYFILYVKRIDSKGNCIL